MIIRYGFTMETNEGEVNVHLDRDGDLEINNSIFLTQAEWETLVESVTHILTVSSLEDETPETS